MARDPKPVLITDAEESPEKEMRRRELRYVAMMLIRAGCLIAAAVLVTKRPPLFGLWLVLCLAGMVLLPWLAVILANDRPAKKRRAPAPAPRPGPEQAALPGPRDQRTIDSD